MQVTHFIVELLVDVKLTSFFSQSEARLGPGDDRASELLLSDHWQQEEWINEEAE